MAASFILIVIFMIFFYAGAGMIANVVLLLNLFMIIGLMAAFGFTINTTTMFGIVLAIDWHARREVQAKLAKLARKGDTSSPEGLARLAHATALTLKDAEVSWLYGAALSTPPVAASEAERLFRATSADVRGRFRHELIRNADGSTRVTAAPEQRAVHRRMQRFHAAVHDLGEPGELRHFAHGNARFAQRARGAARGDELHAVAREGARERDQPVLVGNAEQRAANAARIAGTHREAAPETEARIIATARLSTRVRSGLCDQSRRDVRSTAEEPAERRPGSRYASPASPSFLRNVARVMPSTCAARVWLPRQWRSTSSSIGRSTSASTRR